MTLPFDTLGPSSSSCHWRTSISSTGPGGLHLEAGAASGNENLNPTGTGKFSVEAALGTTISNPRCNVLPVRCLLGSSPRRNSISGVIATTLGKCSVPGFTPLLAIGTGFGAAQMPRITVPFRSQQSTALWSEWRKWLPATIRRESPLCFHLRVGLEGSLWQALFPTDAPGPRLLAWALQSPTLRSAAASLPRDGRMLIFKPISPSSDIRLYLSSLPGSCAPEYP